MAAMRKAPASIWNRARPGRPGRIILVQMKLRFLDKFGVTGALVAAMVCPVCFPLLSAIGSILGLSVFYSFEKPAVYVFQILVILALIGNVISYSHHKKTLVLIFALIGFALIFFAFYVRFNQFIVYLGLLGLVAAAILNYLENRKCKACG